MSYADSTSRSGTPFRIMRDGEIVGRVRAIRNTKKGPPPRKYLMLPTGSDVHSGDRLVSTVTDEEYLIEDVRKADIAGNLVGLNAYYLTSDDIKQYEKQNQASQNWSIGTNYGIVGNQATAHQTFHFDQAALDAEIDRRGLDADDLHELVRQVSELQSQPEIPRGALLRFSTLMQEHSWLTQPIFGALLSYLTTGSAH